MTTPVEVFVAVALFAAAVLTGVGIALLNRGSALALLPLGVGCAAWFVSGFSTCLLATHKAVRKDVHERQRV